MHSASFAKCWVTLVFLLSIVGTRMCVANESPSASLSNAGITPDIHGPVQAVKNWVANEQGSGYLLQPQSGNRVRAWTVTHHDGEANLLVRLLPFTSSIAEPLAGYELVYQSDYGAYLSIYRWTARG
jgi:hydroxylamine oxidation protein HaoB